MKRITILSLSLMIILGLASVSFAQAAPKPKMDAQAMARAAAIVKNNQALFKDPERLKRLMRLAEAMQKAK